MPLRHYATLAVLLTLASCAQPVDTAVMPPVSGLVDPDNAIFYANWAFSSPARTAMTRRALPGRSRRSIMRLERSTPTPGWNS